MEVFHLKKTYNILILGGTRFIGKALLHALISDSEHNIIVFHRGIHESSDDNYRVHHIHGDRDCWNDIKALESFSFDYVFDISGEDFKKVQISVDLLQKHCKKYVFCSSSSVYKPKPDFQYIEDDKLNIDSQDTYIRDKIMSESYVMSNMKNYVIFRPSKVFGPNNHIARERWFYDKTLACENIKINRNPTLHLTHVSDVVSGMLYALNENICGQVFNISGPEHIRLLDYINLVAKLNNGKANIINEFDPTTPYSAVESRIVIHDKLSSLGWKPKINIQNGLINTFNSYE